MKSLMSRLYQCLPPLGFGTPSCSSVSGCTLDGYHAEDAADDLHVLLVHLVTFPSSVQVKAVVSLVGCDYLALASLAELAPTAPFYNLRPLVLAELIQDAVREFALRAVVSPVVEGADLRPVLLELLPEEVMVGGLTGEPVAVLR